MIILRQDVVELRGHSLLQKLSDIWVQFYTSILPTLLAMFGPIQVGELVPCALFRVIFLILCVAESVIGEESNTNSVQGHGSVEDRGGRRSERADGQLSLNPT